MTREQIEQAMQQSSKTIKAIESRKESIILSASSILEDKKLILDLCERVIGLQEALENSNGSICECEVFYNSPNSSYEGLVCERCISIAGALNRFGV